MRKKQDNIIKDLEALNKCLLQENEELARRAENVATANAHAAELMVRLEESNERLAEEVDRRKAAERRLQRINSEIEAKVKKRTFELANVNNQLTHEINERAKVEQVLLDQKKRLDTIWTVILTGILIVDAEMYEIVDLNPFAAKMIGLPKELIIGRTCHKFICPREKGQCPIGDLSQTIDNHECVLIKSNGEEIPILKNVTRAFWQGREFFVESFVDMSEQKEAWRELEKTHEKLMEASRTAGMAEVAADILHNVGNVLNSINVSARFIQEKLSNSKATNLEKVAALVSEHANDLGAFFTKDERARHIPLYLTEVAGFIINEQDVISEKLQSLTRNVDHVKQIIKSQQGYARAGGIEMLTSIPEVIKDALEINRTGFMRLDVDVQLELAETPEIHMDKQNVMQILVNLIKNAKQALGESETQPKVLTIRSRLCGEGKMQIEIADNGIGISGENMARIFRHGFTTKRYGNGFGLHSSALAAKELGGSLTAHSDGPGQGATFILELPLRSLTRTSGSDNSLDNPRHNSTPS